MTAWEEVVERVVATDWHRADPAVWRRAELVVADTMGVMLAGGTTPELSRLVTALGGRPEGGAQVLVDGLPEAAPDVAALVNGTAGTWLELDEAADTGVHAGVHVLAAVLAMAQDRRLPGASLLHGFLVGYEITACLHRHYALTFPVHPHAGLAGIGAAAGTAVMLGQNPMAAARIAGTLAITPTWDACFDGATARHAFAGSAASAAIRAVQMSEAGFTGSATAAETLYTQIAGAPSEVRDCTEVHILRNSFKFHSACLTCHTAIDAALELGEVPERDIRALRVETVPEVADKVGRLPNRTPLSARFSLPYAVAAAFVKRHARPSAFEIDDNVYRLAERVEVALDLALPGGPHDFPARVTLETTSGRRSALVYYPRGHGTRPPREDEVRNKFEGLTAQPALFDRLLGLSALDDSRFLVQNLPSGDSL